MLRGPYWRVSWSPRLLALAVSEADFCSAGGTMRNEDSCDGIRVRTGYVYAGRVRAMVVEK